MPKSRKKVLALYLFLFHAYVSPNIYLGCYHTLIIQLNSGRFPLSVSNTYGFTKLYINEDIHEINLFRGRFVFVIIVF